MLSFAHESRFSAVAFTTTTTTTTLTLFLLALLLRLSSGLYAADVERLHVTSWIRCRYAITVVESRVFNPDDASREAVFDAVLPETGVISNFSLVTGGKKYVGKVEEREAALKEYQRAKSEGELGVVVRRNPRFSNSYKVRWLDDNNNHVLTARAVVFMPPLINKKVTIQQVLPQYYILR